MRPHIDVRAAGATAVRGTLSFAFFAGVPSSTAGADTTARVADVVPGPTRLNVVAGRRAMVAGLVSPAVAHRRIALEKRTARGWRTITRATTRAGGRFAASGACSSRSERRRAAGVRSGG
jgi:hypothetical protein